MNAATLVFHIPELVELILLALPTDTTHTEIHTMRTIHLAQTTSRTWHDLLTHSTPIRQTLYLPTPLDAPNSQIWTQQTPFPPARPNPWIPHIILNQRSWGSAYPFETTLTRSLYEDPVSASQPKFWTFSLELSRAQFGRLPARGRWRDQFATSPPFTDCWYTRSFYELGSGRAPFVTHLDYDAKRPKSAQKYRVHRPGGVTLGDLVDAWVHLFEMHSSARFVMVESLRVGGGGSGKGGGEVELSEDRPTTKMYMPGLSAEMWQL